MSGFDEAKAERGVSAARKQAQGNQRPGATTEALQLTVPLIGNEEDAHGSTPPRLRKRCGYQRDNRTAFIKAEAAAKFD